MIIGVEGPTMQPECYKSLKVVGSVAIATVVTDLFAYGGYLATFMLGSRLKRAENNVALFSPLGYSQTEIWGSVEKVTEI